VLPEADHVDGGHPPLHELPVLLRTTTRVSHTRGPVEYGGLMKPKVKGEFVRDLKRLVMVPAFQGRSMTFF
jgi:TPP-dependent indolepyruvate ferredoxin oxidoreductase alpha subunit